MGQFVNGFNGQLPRPLQFGIKLNFFIWAKAALVFRIDGAGDTAMKLLKGYFYGAGFMVEFGFYIRRNKTVSLLYRTLKLKVISFISQKQGPALERPGHAE